MCEQCVGLGDLVNSSLPKADRHILDGRARLLVGSSALLVNVAAGSAISPLLLAVGSLALIAKAGVPVGTVVRRLATPWYFALVAFAVPLFFFGQTPLFQIGPLLATTEGLARGMLLASKILGGTAVVLALSLTTPMAELLAAAAWLRVPPVLIEVAVLVNRYLFLLAEEAERIREAQTTRLGYTGWRRALISYSQMGGMVLVNAYNRAERVHEGMLLRGYKGHFPTPVNPLTRQQIATCGQLIVGVAAISALGWLL